ncbi:TPA: FecR domain-containing protein [Pseudomonas putida]|uniref:DUF4880 domain-containing protein n=1 Tax=Pseudomonas putida TaxID=303 RepID=A0A1X0ZEV3_PSEPU|nr:FecR domain-containing protein [Pseudomonas putida]KAF0251060.1 DUF4880 domain-containing protein [Pseudomonas putida]KWW13665.1 iron dicitrate transport regulator FecR [Pseudomonas putida]MBH3348251.1 FecR domain-containing protein [Pseudomonas putida]MBH3388087.1 FecR domain-containing protein [Pseudomonas putida]MBS5848336.1 FecR domain-containing protein [Pseudomonas putida]
MNPANQRQALKEAAQWHARLCGNPCCAVTQAQWQAWCDADILNGWAWIQLEQLQASFHGVSGPLARHALAAGAIEPARRTVLKGLMLALGATGVAWTGCRNAPIWLAGTRTETGERRRITLDDGTRLSLNTRSAVDIQYNTEQRLITLRQGEIFVETAPDPRPMWVRSPHGAMRPLGTRFDVRLFPDHTKLVVVEHAVEVRNAATRQAVKVNEGMSLAFDNGVLPEPSIAELGMTEWNMGRLVFDDWRLDRALAELQRYRPGLLRCSDDIAGLRLSGVYPLDDSDSVLAAIAQALKLKIETRTRYWVTLTSLG